ncbi:MAG: hypothetical protein AAGI54_00615 [Planctomycetota bacterium]
MTTAAPPAPTSRVDRLVAAEHCTRAVIELDLAAQRLPLSTDQRAWIDNARLLAAQVAAEMTDAIDLPAGPIGKADHEPARLHDAAYPHA